MIETIGTRLGASLDDAVVVIVSVLTIYAVVILATRLVGLRSFSKMSAFDFAMTVAVGSMIASVGLGQTGVVEGIVAVATIYGAQFTVSLLRRTHRLLGLVDNRPLLLMHGEQVIDEHLDAARITRDDLHSRLRSANVLDPAQVRAVVLETTGDISVLTGGGRLDPSLLANVRGHEYLDGQGEVGLG